MKNNLLAFAILMFSILCVKGQNINSSETSKKEFENELLNSCLECQETSVYNLIRSGVSLKSSKEASHKLYEILLKQMKSERVMSNFSVRYIYTDREPIDIKIFKLLLDAEADTKLYKIKVSSSSATDLGSGFTLHTGKATDDSKIVPSVENGLSALDYVIKNDLSDFKKLLTENTKENTNLLTAVNLGNAQEVIRLIKNGQDVNEKDESGSTAVILAAKHNDIEILKILNSQGADINVQDKYGNTPLVYAVSMNNIEATKWLIDNNANINIKANSGQSALFYAKDTSIVKLLESATTKH